MPAAYGGDGSGGRRRGQRAGAVGSGAQRLEEAGHVIAAHLLRGRDAAGSQVAQVATQVAFVGAQGVGAQPSLDAQMREVAA